MSISSTRRIGSATSSTSKVDRRSFEPNNHSQFVENIDTNNNVLIKDDTNDERENRRQPPARQPVTDFNSASPDISNSIEAMALSGMFEDTPTSPPNNSKVGVYNTNQSIIKDEEIERTGRSYLKHFYEKNEYITDVDEFV